MSDPLFNLDLSNVYRLGEKATVFYWQKMTEAQCKIEEHLEQAIPELFEEDELLQSFKFHSVSFDEGEVSVLATRKGEE